MRFALGDGQRIAAAPGLSGECPMCGSKMLPKCGKLRVWHWAHRGVRNCEHWWEPEAAWHRQWKDEFPADWQEIVHYAEDGEKHIADVRTPHGLTVEFQRSRLPVEEATSREDFYGNMVWVVDGTRLQKDLDRFSGWKNYLFPTRLDGVLETRFPNQCFPPSWLRSRTLVVFDFNGADPQGAAPDPDAELWCLFPGHTAGRALIAPLSRREFVRMAREQSFIFEYEAISRIMAELYQQEEALWFGRSRRSS